MITIELPVRRMDFKEFLSVTVGLMMAGHEKAAEELTRQFIKEVQA